MSGPTNVINRTSRLQKNFDFKKDAVHREKDQDCSVF